MNDNQFYQIEIIRSDKRIARGKLKHFNSTNKKGCNKKMYGVFLILVSIILVTIFTQCPRNSE